jgi:alginate O-acetyltransferase complex protein AlgI
VNSFGDALAFWQAMGDFAATDAQRGLFYRHLGPELFLAMALALLGAFGAFAWLQRVVERITTAAQLPARVLGYAYHLGSTVVYAAILITCTSYLVAGSYNPFIYYRF